VCFNDYDRELALVVEHPGENGDAEIVGVGRLSKLPNSNEAEFAVLISDLWQRKGLGTKLLSMLIQIAKDEKMSYLKADILPENTEMQQVCERLGFAVKRDLEMGTVKAVLKL
jgi:acetyltransferase